VPGPFLELAMVGRQSLVVLGTIRGGCRIAERSPRQRGVKLVVWRVREKIQLPRRKPACVRGRLQSGNVGTREETCLQLPEPVQEGDAREARVLGQILLETTLVGLGIAEGAELRSGAAEGLDEHEVHADEVEAETESESAREVEPGLGLA